MSATFARTLRSLDADRPRLPVAGLSCALLVASGCWATLARVSVYESTDDARLEVSRAAHAVASSLAGRVARADLWLGREVAAGDSLVQLDAADAELAIRERQAHERALRARRQALERETTSERATLDTLRVARTQFADESQALVERVAAKLRFAQTALDRVRPLRQRDAISAADFEQAEALVATTRAELAEARAAAQRGEQDRQAQELACETRIARLEREAVELTGEGEVAAAAIRRLEREVAERLVRAPIAGRIAEVGAVRAGTVIAAGEKLCAVVPEGAPRAVAKFSPSVVGRLKPGQAARLRIDGFPWTQFGAVTATVERIDTEPREGLVRVELALVPVSTSAIPLEHGLTGAAEVEVERAAPIVLALRAAGQFLGTRANPRSKR